MTTYEIMSLVLNGILVSIGVVTIFVVIRIYKQQRNDASMLQENQLKNAERLQKEERRNEIRPDLIDGSAGTSGTDFYSNFYSKNNDTKDIYLADVEVDETKVKIRMDKIRLLSKGREFSVKGNYFIK